MSEKLKTQITHSDLCLAVAKRFNKKFALYEYKSTASSEEPDVLVFDMGGTVLFEIKTSLGDFKKDQKKEARKKYVPHYYIQVIHNRVLEWEKEGDKKPAREFFKLKDECPEVFYVQNDHLGNRRYYVCPWGLIPIEILPEGWGLLYYKNGKFFLKKESAKFRSNLRTENNLIIHALRRYASGDSTGILVNTYGDKE